jgi:uncharacterized membrane protein YiaA
LWRMRLRINRSAMVMYPLIERLKRLPRLYAVLFCYGILVLVGLYVLTPARSREEQFLLALFLAIFAMLAVKSIARSGMEK